MGLRQLVEPGYVRPGDEEWKLACTVITVRTVSLVEGGLRLSPDRLTAEEKADIVRLTRKANEGDDDAGFDLTRLGKREQRRWERLCEVGGGKEPGSVFGAARAASETAAGFRAIARMVAKPKPRIDLHEQGSVTLPKRVVFDWFDRPDPAITISTLGLLAFVCSQFENGQAPGYAKLEGSGDDVALVVDLNLGFGSRFDFRQDVSVGLWRALTHLARQGLLRVERNGPEVTIRQGPKLLKAARRAA
jgi:hypothetical protein